jgi:predicted metal-dependent peptidase
MTQAVQIDEPEQDELAPIKLTPDQEAKWGDTMSLMAWTCPGFRHLFYKLLSNNDGKYGAVPTKGVPVAATDARNILINPEPFFQYALKERVFIMGHEIAHNMFGDVEFLNKCARSHTVPMDDGTTLPFREGTMQKAMDFRINAMLRDSRIGAPPKDCLLDDSIAIASDGVCEVYKRVYDDEENNGGKKVGGKSFDKLLAPGKSNGTPSQPRNQQQWQVEVQAASQLEAMKHQGNTPGALQRMFKSILEPVVPWTEHIRGIFNRKVGNGAYDWRKPDRRFIVRDLYMPGRSGNGAGWVVVWGDTSGSISNVELEKYMAELSSIVDDCQPARLTIIWCDAEIHRIDEIGDAADMEHLKAEAATSGVGGGGGTSVMPVMDWIAEHHEKPEVFIGFTDGFVSFPPQAPDYLTIWAATTDHAFPWGDVVRINHKPVHA